MQYLRVCFSLCFCGVALAAPHKPFLDNPPGNSPVIGKIERFPYQVGIIADDNSGAGAIIGKKFILTSAFLVYGQTNIRVRVGSDNLMSGGDLISVEKVLIHDKYTYSTEYETYTFDFALLKLSKGIEYGKTRKPVRLANKESVNGTAATVSGYEYTTLLDQGGFLQQGKISIFDRDSCRTYYTPLGITLDETTVCAYSRAVCPCVNDYGDPLVVNGRLVGNFRGGTYCCVDDRPQVFSNVANPKIKKWIRKRMKAEGHGYKENIGHYFGG